MEEKYCCVIDAEGFYKDLVLISMQRKQIISRVLDLDEFGIAEVVPCDWKDLFPKNIPKETMTALMRDSDMRYAGATDDGRMLYYARSSNTPVAAVMIADPSTDTAVCFAGPLADEDNILTIADTGENGSITFTFRETEEEREVEEVQYYTLAEGESLVPRTDECRQPTMKVYTGAPGYIRPKWDGAGWVEGATDEEITAWELEHPSPVIVQQPTPEEDMDALMVDHEYRLTLLELGVTNDAV